MVVKSSILLVKPHAHDVLLGNDNVIIKHIGTIFYRRLVERCRVDHTHGSLNKEGKNAAQEVFDEVKTLDPPGRFLLSASNDFTEWYEVSNQKALEKIRIALGERTNIQGANNKHNTHIIADAPKQVPSNVDAMSNTPTQSLHSFQNFQESVLNVPRTGNNIPFSLHNLGNLNRFLALNNDQVSNDTSAKHKNGSSSSSLKSRIIDKYKVSPKDNPSFEQSMSGTTATSKHEHINDHVVPEHASLKSNLISLSDNESGISSITKETSATIVESFNRPFFANAINNAPGVRSKRNHGVCLPKFDDSYESLLSMDKAPINKVTKPSSSNQDNFVESSIESSSQSSTEKVSKKKRKKPDISESKKEPKQSMKESKQRGKESDFHQQVMMPVSYIGQSFSNLDDCSDETKRIFEEIANLGRLEDNATLFLPGIIGSLCQRIVELERKDTLSD